MPVHFGMDSSDSDYDYSLCEMDEVHRRRRRSRSKGKSDATTATVAVPPEARMQVREPRGYSLTLPKPKSKKVLTRKQEWIERLHSTNPPNESMNKYSVAEDGDYMIMRPRTVMEVTLNSDSDYMEMTPNNLYVVRRLQLTAEPPKPRVTAPATDASTPNNLCFPSSGLGRFSAGLSRSQPNLGRLLNRESPIVRRHSRDSQQASEGEYMEMQPFGQGKGSRSTSTGNNTLSCSSRNVIVNSSEDTPVSPTSPAVSFQGVNSDGFESECPYINVSQFEENESAVEHVYADPHELIARTKAYNSSSSCSSISSDEFYANERDIEVHSEPESFRSRIDSNPPIARSKLRRKSSDGVLNRLTISSPPRSVPPKALRLLGGNEDDVQLTSGKRSPCLGLERSPSFRHRVTVAVKRLAKATNSPTSPLTESSLQPERAIVRRHTTSQVPPKRHLDADDEGHDVLRRHSGGDPANGRRAFPDQQGNAQKQVRNASALRTGTTPSEGSQALQLPLCQTSQPPKPRPYKEYVGRKETLKALTKSTLV